uniref:YEATS family, putative n=2 Tax=Theileria annulata TaxID=5874 RepID=A0A3B0NEK0_THEAN
MKHNRLKGIKIGKRIVVGTYAFPLNPSEKKRYGSMTHRWVCILRSLDDENMAHYVKRVQFDLDPSFLNPKRVFTSIPYEVTEVGWGEFYIGVKIFFVDESLEPVTLQHLLRLNSGDGSNVITTAVNETFDEIIFNEPHEWFYDTLIRSSCDKLPPSKYRDYFWNFDQKEKETVCRYICSQSYFQNETYRLLAEASELCKQIQQLQEQYYLLENKSPGVLLKDKPFNSMFLNPNIL